MDSIKYARMFSTMTLPEILQTKPHQAISWDSKTMNLYSDLSNFMKKYYMIACSSLSGQDIPAFLYIRQLTHSSTFLARHAHR